MDYELSLQDYARLLKRRLTLFIGSMTGLIALGAIVVFSLPSMYQSSGTILVESQQIPSELVQSTVTTLAQERIRVIEQRVMTRANILKVIDKYKLFESQTNALSDTDKVDLVRGRMNIAIDNITQQNRNRRGETTVIFHVRYEDPNPRKALRVTNEFVTLFLEENVRTRTSRASETTEFLTQESDRLGRDLKAQEKEVADFKDANSTALPEHMALHFSMLERAREDYSRTEENILKTQESLRLFDLELSALRSGRTDGDGSNGIFSPSRELAQLQSQLASLRLSYLDTHPEIQNLLDRMEKLKVQLEEEDQRKQLTNQLAEQESARDQLVQSGELDAGQMQRIDNRIQTLKDKLATTGDGDPLSEARTAADLQEARLAYRQSAIESRLEKLIQDRVRLGNEIEDLERRIQLTPRVEGELSSLERNYEATLAQFNAITAKMKEAELAENLEEGQKAERFVLLDPPILAEDPARPNRPKLMAVVLLFSAVGAGIIAFVRDFLLGIVHSPTQLAHRLGSVRVIQIPTIISAAEKLRHKRLLVGAAASVPMMAIIALIGIHFLYQPIDLLFYKALAKLS